MSNDLMTCVFNPSHKLDGHRYVKHLMICQKQYPYIKVYKCPFNGAHWGPIAEEQQHLQNCPDNQMILDHSKGDSAADNNAPRENLPEEHLPMSASSRRGDAVWEDYSLVNGASGYKASQHMVYQDRPMKPPINSSKSVKKLHEKMDKKRQLCIKENRPFPADVIEHFNIPDDPSNPIQAPVRQIPGCNFVKTEDGASLLKKRNSKDITKGLREANNAVKRFGQMSLAEKKSSLYHVERSEAQADQEEPNVSPEWNMVGRKSFPSARGGARPKVFTGERSKNIGIGRGAPL